MHQNHNRKSDWKKELQPKNFKQWAKLIMSMNIRYVFAPIRQAELKYILSLRYGYGIHLASLRTVVLIAGRVLLFADVAIHPYVMAQVLTGCQNICNKHNRGIRAVGITSATYKIVAIRRAFPFRNCVALDRAWHG